MLRRHLRGVLGAALLTPILLVPVVAEARAPALTCPTVTQLGLWQRLPVEEFRAVPGVSTRDSVTGYALDAARPQRLLVTNGNTIKLSESHGCAWTDVLVLSAEATDDIPVSGVTSTLAAVAHLPNGPSLAAVREGTGAASRPHVLRSDSGARDSWSDASTGLPTQGSPRLLEPAGDGRTAYLSLSPATDAGGSGGTLPSLPGAGGEQAGPAGLLYATTDGGRSWQLRTTAAALPSGVSGFDALAVDAADPALIYALSGGRLVVSRDGGRTLAVNDEVAGATAIEPMDAGEVAVLVGSGQLLHSKDGGTSFVGRPAPAGAGSAAYRRGDGTLVVEADGVLYAVDARGRGGFRPLDAGVPATRGSARGDRVENGSFHALAGHSVLRYVDPAPVKEVDPPRAPGDLGAPPPPPGRMAPPSRGVRMPVGSSQVADFTLVLPRSPTPLDLYLLLDVSESMVKVLDDIKKNLDGVADDIAARGIDLRVGLGTVAAGPREGEAPYQETDPRDPEYRRPDVYKRVREIGEVNDDLRTALRNVSITPPPPGRRGNAVEGGLVGLDQLRKGEGVPDRRPGAALTGGYVVPPGQQAGFRPPPGIRRVVVTVTDEPFTDPYGVRKKPDGTLDLEGVAADLKAAGIKQVGLAAKANAASKPDLERMARLTDTFAPPGGVDCGDDVFIPAGAPLVCDSSSNFSDVLTRLVLGLADKQSVTLAPRETSPILGDIDAAGLRNLDVTRSNEIPFRVRVSCADVAAGSYTTALDAVLRGTKVATAKIDVTCTPLATAAVPPPRPPAPQVQEPAPPAGQPAQAPPPPAPAPPVVQPQPQPQAQVQVQTQVQPMTAAALQQQEQLQLALALQADEAAPRNELAMVDRRRGEELRALALLALAMGAASTVGLARLRSRQEQVVRVRQPS